MIPDEKLQELRDRIDIVDLIGRYVGLKRAGKNFTACCPFHQERTPSFFVNPERRSYKCFGCGVWATASTS
ncbi:CHC2 zinc finger domain-containing protein [Nannocystis pusilla]|uniref:CHC2 zinc finger domain-containing protein n=1 Tax=Nannocystis pusilla TaxID=889268 RepID=UPI003B8042D3